MNRILLLEDDPLLAKGLLKYLIKSGYRVDWAKNGEEAIEFSFNNEYDLYLFDINVPLINGIDLLKELRVAEDFTPTIIISALVDIDSITDGFVAGADDYLKKPFDPDELLIRIKARTDRLKERLEFRDFEIDIQRGIIKRDGKILNIGKVQKQIFIDLVKNYPNPVTSNELLNFLEKSTNLALRVNISKLKKELNIDIKNIRGVGYKII